MTTPRGKVPPPIAERKTGGMTPIDRAMTARMRLETTLESVMIEV
jgi:hypothetical protein